MAIIENCNGGHKVALNSRKRILAKWALIGVAIVILAGSFGVEWHHMAKIKLIQIDYGYYYYAFQVALHHQPATSLYNITAQQALFRQLHLPVNLNNQYVYPPTFALLGAPLALLPFHSSANLWTALSIVLYGLGVFWIARICWPHLCGWRMVVLILFAAVLDPFENDVAVGNINSILFAAIALTFYLLYHRKLPGWAGIPLGFAILFKVTPVAVLVFLLLRRHWRTSASAVITGAVVGVVTMLWFGSSSLVNYAKNLSSLAHRSMQNGPAPYNQSVIGVLGLFHKHQWLQWSSTVQHLVFYIFACSAACLIFYVVRRTRADGAMDSALASFTPLLFSPLVERMYFVFAVPALLFLAREVQVSFRQGAAKQGAAKQGGARERGAKQGGVKEPTEIGSTAMGSTAEETTGKEPTAMGRAKSILLGIITLCGYLILSLPATVAVNAAVHHWNQLFWLDTYMFWALVVLFSSTAWVAFRYTGNRK